MYGLDPKIDLSFLNGREVIQVAMGIFQIQFGFDEDVRISVEAEFKYFDGSNESVWKYGHDYIQVAAQAVALLSHKILRYEASENGTLQLFFSSGHTLTIPDTSKEFESYSITAPGRNIYV
jgi:hypothetical protein